MSYRLELAKSQRSGCANLRCKDKGEKIPKGDLRQGTMVTIQERQSWKWRHWGCVTPAQIANMSSNIGDNLDNLDGYDELPDDLQEKVRRAFDQGHVDDEEWSGDVEKNRPGQRGYRDNHDRKLRDRLEIEDAALSTSPSMNRSPSLEPSPGPGQTPSPSPSPTPRKAAPRKRRRAKERNDEDNEADDVQGPPKKKTKAPAKKAEKAKDQDIEAAPAKKAKASAKRDKKVAEDAVTDASGSDETPPPKKPRGRKPKVTEEDTVGPAGKAPKAKRGPKKSVENGSAGADDSANAKIANEPRPTRKAKRAGKNKSDTD